jgi:hypothetical protein
MNYLPDDPLLNSPEGESTKPMQPLDPTRRQVGSSRRSTRQREPIQAFTEVTQALQQDEVDELLSERQAALPRASHRQADPLVAFLILVALGIGIAPLDPMIRYLLLWSGMAGLGVLAYLLGGVRRMREAQIDDLVWGVVFGFLSSFPFLLVFGSALGTVSVRMFDAPETPTLVMDSWVFMAVVFVGPLSETLFFRGGMQSVRSLFLTSLLATLWSAVLFFPHMELGGRTTIALIMLMVFGLLNFMYSYVQFRNGLAAAWLCQVISYALLWFSPRILF